MWPFRKLTPEQIEDREWRRYRNRIGSTMASQGYRGDPVSVEDAFAWADAYVAEARAQQAKWRADDLQDGIDERIDTVQEAALLTHLTSIPNRLTNVRRECVI